MSFSLLSQALLRHMLPDAAWTPLVADFGYCVGFLTAVLGRQQLFTETTITVILPIFAEFTRRNVFLGMRMWAIVLTANITGTFLAAAFFSFAPVVSADVRSVMIDISQHAMMPDGSELLFRAIVSGFLIALMVWMLPSAEGTEFHLIVMVTYLISIASFAHIVAGSMEGFMLVISGEQSLLHMLVHFTLPVLTGNVIGGTALFAVLSYAQVMHEI